MIVRRFSPCIIASYTKRLHSTTSPSPNTIKSQGNLEGVNNLFNRLVKGDRGALAKCITLVESTRTDHHLQSSHLIQLCLSRHQLEQSTHLNNLNGEENNFRGRVLKPALRIGVSGAPGVGKSTFIETLGTHILSLNSQNNPQTSSPPEDHHKIAVLAIDPSSSVTGGSILGDKTRMPHLSTHPRAFVRPSPASGTLGGVCRATQDSITLCESAGYDIVLVETVGVGQSETAVAEMVDLFLVLVGPGGGDELQGVKKGIVEIADLIVINKSDGAFKAAAIMTQLEYVSALKLIRPRCGDIWRPRVMPVSSIDGGLGIEELWKAIMEYRTSMLTSGLFYETRAKQRSKWLWRLVREGVVDRVKGSRGLIDIVQGLERGVLEGVVSPGRAADQIIERFLRSAESQALGLRDNEDIVQSLNTKKDGVK